MYKWRLQYRECNKFGLYRKSNSWRDVSLEAPTLNAALKKALEATGTEYYTCLKVFAEEVQPKMLMQKEIGY